MRMNGIGALAVALALAACGDDGPSAADFVGLYEVTHHTNNMDSCDQEGPDANDYTHFALMEGEIFGQSYVSFGECTSSDPSTCNDGGLFSGYIRTGGEWVNQLTTSSGGGDVTCFLTYLRGTMTEGEPGELRFETQQRSDEDELSEELCDPDTAEDRGESMPCDFYEVIEGVFLADLPPDE